MEEKGKTEEITLKELVLIIQDWIGYFISKWKWIVPLGLLGAGAGFFYAYSSKPVYTAELTLALDDKSGGSPYSGIASQFGLDMGGSAGGVFTGDNNLELIKSRKLIEQTLLTAITIEGNKQTLVNRYIVFHGLNKDWEENPKLKDVSYLPGESRDSFSLEKDSVLFGIYKAIKAKAVEVGRTDKKLSIINLKVKSEDPYFAKYFAEKLIENATAFYIETKTSKSRRNVDLLEFRLDSVKNELNKELYSAAINRDMNTNVIRAVGGIQAKKKEINVQVLGSMYAELTKNLEMAKFMLMKEEPMIQIIDRPIFPLEYKRKGKLTSMILGGLIAGFLGLGYFAFVRLKREIMGEEEGIGQ